MVRQFFLWAVMLVSARAETPLADLRWPPISGELSGVTRFDVLGDALPVTWTLRALPGSGGAPQFEVQLSANGLALLVNAMPPTGESAGTWKLVNGSVDLAVWRPLVLAHVNLAEAAPDLIVTGALRLTGGGTWREGEVTGEISGALSDATASSATQNWSLAGLSLMLEVTLTKNIPTVRAVRFAIETAKAAGLVARRIAVAAEGAPGGKIAVRRAELEILGGHVALTPFTLDPASPSIDTAADLAGIALGDVAELAPQALAEARGQIAGRVSVRWSANAGVEPGAGTLRVGLDTPASVRLAAKPGFLTERVPARFNLAGQSLGPVSRALSIENPAYDTLRRVELGELPLVVDGLEVRLYPDGLDGAVSARVDLSGHPAEAKSAVGAVSFQVNVAGPLSQVLKLGMQKNSSLSFGAGR